ncbi:hypothetical protein AVEN_199584-1 [Araneus ventricosus]|uniref:Uncharacterized protein n=1 Tax=Araneus ventricosus TaxID=182803 RepID=A0A4Y2TKR8_ARAVE|nr:hypothetical protein AVEN_199584-1 [Araneus ventricosus]
MKRKAYKHFCAIIRIPEIFSSTSFRKAALKLPYFAIRFNDKEFNCCRKRSFLPPASKSIVKLITTNLSLSTKSSMEGKAEARKHVFQAYDCKIQTRKKPNVPIFKATEREEITRFCGSRSRFA